MDQSCTIKDLRARLRRREVSHKEVAAFYQSRLKKYAPDLNCMVEIFDDYECPEELPKGDLGGIPGLLKDNICQKDRIASGGSNILRNFKSPYSATVKEKISEAGGIILGRTNMDEFAMGTSGEFSAYGPTKNPWKTSHSPGGSSAGSAAAVAASLAPWALGTETGGSIRQPASFCGLVGLYPTYGLFSRYGLLPFGSSLDQPGPLTKTVYDNAIVSSVMSGHDQLDSNSLPEPKKDFTKNLDGKLPENLKIGIIRDSLESEGILPEIKQKFNDALDWLENLGATVEVVDLPMLKYGISVFFIVSRAEAASNLSRFDGSLFGLRDESSTELQEMYIESRTKGFGEEVKRRILTGNYVLSAGHRGEFYEKALHVRAAIRAGFEDAFSSVDVLASPTTTTLPFTLGKESQDSLAMYMADYFTVPNCVAGLPALSLPCGFSKDSNFPIGFQFIGPRLSEELLYKVAYAYEQSTDFHTKFPEGYE